MATFGEEHEISTDRRATLEHSRAPQAARPQDKESRAMLFLGRLRASQATPLRLPGIVQPKA